MNSRSQVAVAAVPAAVLLLLGAGCSSGGTPTAKAPGGTAAPTVTHTATPTHPGPRARPVAAALVAYGSCPRLRQSLRLEALAEVTPYGLPQSLRRLDDFALASTSGSLRAPAPASLPQAAKAAADAPVGTTFSGTNNQEAGVDEPDLVKTDGKVLLVLQQRPPVLRLVRVSSVSGDRPVPVGRLALPVGLQAPQLLLLGDRALVLGSESDAQGARSTVRVVDISDPASPSVERTFSVDGQVVDARLIGKRVVLAVQSTPSVPVTYPLSPKPIDLRMSLLINRRAVAAVADSNVLSTVTVQPGGTRYRADCASALHPGVPSGLGTTTLLTLDPAADKPTQTTTIVGSTSNLYASTTSLYLATSAWNPTGSVTTTDLHGFDLTDPDHPRPLGSGSVPGRLLDQYALSAAHSDLRVATTSGGDSRVTVLRPEDGVLTTVGTLTGLGKGEQIYGVRYVGDLAYVVTFHQTDPLYVVDLTDSAHPRLRGQLELTGFSSTLYPLDGTRLLGVGQGADVTGRQRGLQLSVFDVASPDRPRLAGRTILAASSSPAEQDHHALLWWKDTHLLVLPLIQYDGKAPSPGAVAFRVAGDGALTEAARISPPPATDQGFENGPVRELVVGDLLYSVTEHGLVTNRLDELSTQSWTPFP